MTATVSIRDTIESDLGALFEFQADPEASAMAAFPSRDLHAFLENQHKIEVDPAAVEQTIVVDGDVVGSVLSWDGPGVRLVGYWIGRDYWRKGYATAALRAFLDVDRHRPLQAHVAEHNVASRRVLEKCGFVFDRSEVADDGILEHVFLLTT